MTKIPYTILLLALALGTPSSVNADPYSYSPYVVNPNALGTGSYGGTLTQDMEANQREMIKLQKEQMREEERRYNNEDFDRRMERAERAGRGHY